MLFSFTYLFNLQLDCPMKWRIELELRDGDKKDEKGVAKKRITSLFIYKDEPMEDEPIGVSATKPWLADCEVTLFPNSIWPRQDKGCEDSIRLTL
jgi:hypothetical protein